MQKHPLQTEGYYVALLNELIKSFHDLNAGKKAILKGECLCILKPLSSGASSLIRQVCTGKLIPEFQLPPLFQWKLSFPWHIPP